MEAEKAARSNQAGPSDLEKQPARSPSTIVGFLGLSTKWLLPSNFAFDPGLLTDLGILRNIEMPPNIRSNS